MPNDVTLIFARGSGEVPGLGIVGNPLYRALRRALRGTRVSAYAVDYAAAWNQSTAAAGANDLVERLVQLAEASPRTVFALGGYSQGASVVSIALGARAASVLAAGSAYRTVPASIAPRVRAVVLFGSPASRYGARIGGPYASRTREFCNEGDPVCMIGRNYLAHLTYGYNGSTAAAAAFIAERVRS